MTIKTRINKVGMYVITCTQGDITCRSISKNKEIAFKRSLKIVIGILQEIQAC